jgi:hypothetical protein
MAVDLTPEQRKLLNYQTAQAESRLQACTDVGQWLVDNRMLLARLERYEPARLAALRTVIARKWGRFA